MWSEADVIKVLQPCSTLKVSANFIMSYFTAAILGPGIVIQIRVIPKHLPLKTETPFATNLFTELIMVFFEVQKMLNLFLQIVPTFLNEIAALRTSKLDPCSFFRFVTKSNKIFMKQ